MYEPKFTPQFLNDTINLSGVRFGIVYSNKYLDPANNPGADPLHMHKQPEIFFNIDSDVSFLVNNRLYHVPCGSAIVSRGNDLHVAIFHNAKRHAYACLWLDCDNSKELLNFINGDDFYPLFAFDEGTALNIQRLIYTLDTLCKNESATLARTAYLLQLLSLFEKAPREVSASTELPHVLQAVMDDIHRNFVSINHVSDLLREHYISQATLNRYFRRYIHTSPLEYLQSQKLAYAAKLLLAGKTVTEACIQSGFGDCSRFIVLFKRKFSMTPMQYKNMGHSTLT